MSEQSPEKPLTTKQKVFVTEYLVDFNATQAAIRAGYSEKTAASIGSENLRKPEIQAEIQRCVAERAMGKNEILLRLADIARGDLADLMSIGPTGYTLELGSKDDNGQFIVNPKTKLIRKIKQKVTTLLSKKEDGEDREIVETELELYSALEALALLGKAHSLFVDRTEMSGPDGGPVEVSMVEVVLPPEDPGDGNG